MPGKVVPTCLSHAPHPDADAVVSEQHNDILWSVELRPACRAGHTQAAGRGQCPADGLSPCLLL